MLISGKSYWAKIVGKPSAGYQGSEPEWAIDVALDKKSIKALKDAGCGSYIKNKGDDRGDFITLKRKAVKSDGTPAKPIKIVDHHNEPWNNRLIGNGSEVNVSVALNEREFRGKKFLKPSILAVQVWNLVEYQPKGDFPTRDDAPVEVSDEENW